MQIPIFTGHAAFHFLLTKTIADLAIIKAMDSSKTEIAQKQKQESDDE